MFSTRPKCSHYETKIPRSCRKCEFVWKRSKMSRKESVMFALIKKIELAKKSSSEDSESDDEVSDTEVKAEVGQDASDSINHENTKKEHVCMGLDMSRVKSFIYVDIASLHSLYYGLRARYKNYTFAHVTSAKMHGQFHFSNNYFKNYESSGSSLSTPGAVQLRKYSQTPNTIAPAKPTIQRAASKQSQKLNTYPVQLPPSRQPLRST
ncbi:hypothetical protein WICPIJ_000557 [Wickerhamomyces pijperi]|uniref:Uncharacterized protein n=1 Tax=Wickerhamomyces pijperi TaxID=599730 RepID=A0A9P8QCI7_WICPI|nr:hypothetical protein WICPIJ_000557 [Wickerhamomyces pijperi]